MLPHQSRMMRVVKMKKKVFVWTGMKHMDKKQIEHDPIFNEEEDLDGNTYNLEGEPFGRVNMDDDDNGQQ